MGKKTCRYEAIVIGVSSGGIAALEKILPEFDGAFRPSIVTVLHIGVSVDNYLVEYFNQRCRLRVKEAEDKERIVPGIIYFAPPGYHLLIELDRTFSLSTEAKVNYSRPSIDVLFETAAEAYLDRLVGIVLTGANADGAAGLAVIKQFGGLTVVQDPQTAEAELMPKAAIARSGIDHILPLAEIGPFLAALG